MRKLACGSYSAARAKCESGSSANDDCAQRKPECQRCKNRNRECTFSRLKSPTRKKCQSRKGSIKNSRSPKASRKQSRSTKKTVLSLCPSQKSGENPTPNDGDQIHVKTQDSSLGDHMAPNNNTQTSSRDDKMLDSRFENNLDQSIKESSSMTYISPNLRHALCCNESTPTFVDEKYNIRSF